MSEEAEEVLGMDDVDTLESPKLVLGDSAVAEIAAYMTHHEEAYTEELARYCTHPDQFAETLVHLHRLYFLDYDKEEDLFTLADSPVAESLTALCRQVWRKHKEVQDKIGMGEGGQIDSILFRERDGERLIRINGQNVAGGKTDHE